MTKATVATQITAPHSVPADPATVDALVTLGGLIETFANYQVLLETQVFAKIRLPDRKAAQRHQKVLLGAPALPILIMIWKESGFVGDAEIFAGDVERHYSECDPMNCHGLATRLAADASDLERQQKRIQAVAAAAEAYGLLTREKFKTTRRMILRGTEELHILMLAVSADVRIVFSDILAPVPGGL
jgi:hypothetical protein